MNCAGQWARQLGAMAGVNVPLVSVQHQYMVTERIEGVTPNLPTLRDPDRLTYYKEEVGGLVMGGYEPNPIPWAENGFPENFEFSLLQPDFDHFTPTMELALGRVPALATAGVKQLINGPESFTPDGNFILGEAPELRGFFVGAGFNAFGIASGGGAGKVLAEWVAGGEAPYDLWPVDIRRFGRNHADIDWVRARTLQAYARHYTIAYPSEEFTAGRPLRRSPLYAALQTSRCRVRRKTRLGAPQLVRRPLAKWPKINTPMASPTGSPPSRASTRPRAMPWPVRPDLLRQISRLTGRDAEAALSWICANDVAKPPGSLTYTQMLNARGGIECDLTVVRLSAGRILHHHRHRFRHA